MSHHLPSARNHASSLCRILMVPVILVEVDAEFGVMPSDELDARDNIAAIGLAVDIEEKKHDATISVHAPQGDAIRFDRYWNQEHVLPQAPALRRTG